MITTRETLKLRQVAGLINRHRTIYLGIPQALIKVSKKSAREMLASFRACQIKTVTVSTGVPGSIAIYTY